MESTGSVDHELWQSRLSRFGRVLAIFGLVYVGLHISFGLWMHQPVFESVQLIPPLTATVAVNPFLANITNIVCSSCGSTVPVDVCNPALTINEKESPRLPAN